MRIVNYVNASAVPKKLFTKLLKREFEQCFPDLNDTELPSELKMTSKSFRLNTDIFSENLQKEFLKM